MSDFDKEAEREKLREKYERDKEEREATQRMSDLLLKGATMTNAHCGTCGDPLFKQDGTTFCPSCHGTPDAVQGTELEARQPETDPTTEASSEAGQSGTDSTADRPADQASTDADGETDRTDAAAGSPTSAIGTDSASGSSRAGSVAESASSSDRRGDERTRDHVGETTPSASGAGPVRRSPARTPPSVDGDLEAARDALVRSVERFAGEAAATDDPRYAKECLEAAREASETLMALR